MPNASIENESRVSYKDLFEMIVKAMVDFPDRVTIEEIVRGRAVIVTAYLDQSDVGKVIGKEGKNIGALKTIFIAAAMARQDSRTVLIEVEGT